MLLRQAVPALLKTSLSSTGRSPKELLMVIAIIIIMEMIVTNEVREEARSVVD